MPFIIRFAAILILSVVALVINAHREFEIVNNYEDYKLVRAQRQAAARAAEEAAS